jgi:hypothetical protein
MESYSGIVVPFYDVQRGSQEIDKTGSPLLRFSVRIRKMYESHKDSEIAIVRDGRYNHREHLLRPTFRYESPGRPGTFPNNIIKRCQSILLSFLPDLSRCQ